MKLTIRNSKTGNKAIVTVRGKLVNNGDGTAKVEMTAPEAMKVALQLAVQGLTTDEWNALPSALDKDAEEILMVTQIAVTTNGGPSVGVRTDVYESQPLRFTSAMSYRDEDIIEYKEAPKAASAVTKTETPAPVEKKRESVVVTAKSTKKTA